ncbi:hypothetical protein LINPERHAP1_LOCUS30184 [Linum perenne]
MLGKLLKLSSSFCGTATSQVRTLMMENRRCCSLRTLHLQSKRRFLQFFMFRTRFSLGSISVCQLSADPLKLTPLHSFWRDFMLRLSHGPSSFSCMVEEKP